MLLLFSHLCFQSQVVLTADEGLQVETFCFTKCFFMLRKVEKMYTVYTRSTESVLNISIFTLANELIDKFVVE